MQSRPYSGSSTVVQEVSEIVEGEVWIISVSTWQSEGKVVASKHQPQHVNSAKRLSGVSSRVLLIGVVEQQRSPIGITETFRSKNRLTW